MSRHIQVVMHFGVHVCTIERFVRRLGQTGLVNDRTRSGHPNVTSHLQDWFICVEHLKNCHITVACPQNSECVSSLLLSPDFPCFERTVVENGLMTVTL